MESKDYILIIKYYTVKKTFFLFLRKLSPLIIKLFSDIDKRTQECNIMLKISGVWENIREYGITFKFMDSQS